jgi:hypothetical protein
LKVTPPHIVDLQEKLRDHPSQQRAEQRVCEAKWNILLGKSNYYPRLNATLSGGSKWIDQSSRADEFGGSNSSEYDGEGLNATLSLRQHIYDWGRNASIITGHRQDRFVAQIERQATLEQQLSSLSSMALDYVLQVRLIDHFMDSQKIIDRDVNSMEQRFKAGAARLAEMRQATGYCAAPLYSVYELKRYSARAINTAPTLSKIRCVHVKNVASCMVSNTRLPSRVPSTEAAMAAPSSQKFGQSCSEAEAAKPP